MIFFSIPNLQLIVLETANAFMGHPTVLRGSELFVNLSSQKAQKSANLDVFVNLILQFFLNL